MVKTRKPKASAAAVANESDGMYKSKDELPDDKIKMYNSLLEDYDRQVNQKIEEITNRIIAEGNKMANEVMLSKMKLPMSVRNLDWESMYKFYMESTAEVAPPVNAVKAAAEGLEKDREIKQLQEQIASDVQQAVKETKQTTAKKRKQAKPRGESNQESLMVPSTAVRRSTRKRTNTTTFTPGGHGVADESVLTSTANTTRTRGRRVLETPGNISMVAPPPKQLPMITPKVGGVVPFTPMTNVRQRLPKDGEVAFSMQGSPLYVGGTTAARRGGRGGGRKGGKENPDFALNLRPGQTLQLQLDKDQNEVPDIELDEESKAKVLAVREQLDKLLKLT